MYAKQAKHHLGESSLDDLNSYDESQKMVIQVQKRRVIVHLSQIFKTLKITQIMSLQACLTMKKLIWIILVMYIQLTNHINKSMKLLKMI